MMWPLQNSLADILDVGPSPADPPEEDWALLDETRGGSCGAERKAAGGTRAIPRRGDAVRQDRDQCSWCLLSQHRLAGPRNPTGLTEPHQQRALSPLSSS